MESLPSDSDRGPSFLLKLPLSVCERMSVEKVNSCTYPQTDGLVEQFNHTQTDMLAKSVLRTWTL